MLKRFIDVVVSTFALIVFSPVLLLVAALIKVQDGGPVFYRGARVGRGGRPFQMLKFRTMVVDAEKLGPSSTASDDPRITRMGAFLRKYKPDELPEFLNVLCGEMSLVGPRPEVQQYVDMLSEEEKAILTVRPGITDWATLWNSDEGALLAGSDDPERIYREQIRPIKIRLQLKYVREQSFWTDMKILLQTLLAIIFRLKPKALEMIREKG